MEMLREELVRLIDTKGISSKEVMKASKHIDKLIVKHYKRTSLKYFNLLKNVRL